MVGVGSPSRLGITHNNSYSWNANAGVSFNSASFGNLTSRVNRVRAPIGRLGGLLPCDMMPVYGSNAQIPVIPNTQRLGRKRPEVVRHPQSLGLGESQPMTSTVSASQ